LLAPTLRPRRHRRRDLGRRGGTTRLPHPRAPDDLGRRRATPDPLRVGITPPLGVEPRSRGPFAAGGTAFFSLRTHAAYGIIHIESPIERIYTLRNFFDIWHKPLGRDRVGPMHGCVTAFFNGRHYLGNPLDIPLLAPGL
jgi:hypothetical protein